MINDETCSDVIYGILKKTSFGIFSFTKFLSSFRSEYKTSLPLSLKISATEVKYLFKCVAISSEDAYWHPSMTISSGKRLIEVLSLLFTFRRCFQIVRVSFESMTDFEKCSRFALRIRYLVFYSLPKVVFVYKGLFVCAMLLCRRYANQVIVWFLPF